MKFKSSRIAVFILLVSAGIAVILSQMAVAGNGASLQSFIISGHVTDGFGNIISGATVTLSSVSNAGTVTTVATTTSDSGGNYSFANVAAGNYSLNAALSGRRDTLTFAVTVNNLNGDLTKDLQILFFASFQIWTRDSAGTGTVIS